MTASSLWLLALGSASGRLPFWELGAWTEGPPVSRWWVRSSDKKCPSTHVFSGARLHNFVRSFQVGPAGCYEGLSWGPGSPLKVRNLKYRPVGLLPVRLASSQHNFLIKSCLLWNLFCRKAAKAKKEAAAKQAAGRPRRLQPEEVKKTRHLNKLIYYWQFSWALKDAGLFSKLLSSFWDCGSVLMVGGDIPPLPFSFHFIFWSDLSIFGLSIGL